MSRCKVGETYDCVGAGDAPVVRGKYTSNRSPTELTSYCTQSKTARSPSGKREVRRYTFVGVRTYETELGEIDNSKTSDAQPGIATHRSNNSD